MQFVVLVWGESQRDIEMTTQILEQVRVCVAGSALTSLWPEASQTVPTGLKVLPRCVWRTGPPVAASWLS